MSAMRPSTPSPATGAASDAETSSVRSSTSILPRGASSHAGEIHDDAPPSPSKRVAPDSLAEDSAPGAASSKPVDV